MCNTSDDLAELTTQVEFDTYLDMLTDPSELPPLGCHKPVDPLDANSILWIVPGRFNDRLDDRLKSVFDLLAPKLAGDVDRNHLIDLLNQISRLRP